MTGDEILEQTGASGWINHDNSLLYSPSYNVSPTRFQAVLVQNLSLLRNHLKVAEAPELDQTRPRLAAMRWGMVCSFQKDMDRPSPINAQGERVCDGTSFWKRLRSQSRCVVVVSGYYEWHTEEDGRKQPFYITRKEGEILYLAGLYDVAPNVTIKQSLSAKAANYWKNRISRESLQLDLNVPVCSCAILTTKATPPALARIHDRQPVMLRSQKDVETWLTGDWRPELEELLNPFGLETKHPDKAEDFVICRPVSAYVNKTTNDGEHCLDDAKQTEIPLSDRLQGKISDHFAAKSHASPLNSKEGEDGDYGTPSSKSSTKVLKEEPKEGEDGDNGTLPIKDARKAESLEMPEPDSKRLRSEKTKVKSEL